MAKAWPLPKYLCAFCGWGFTNLNRLLQHKAKCQQRPPV
jgi:ribosomal protein L37E